MAVPKCEIEISSCLPMTQISDHFHLWNILVIYVIYFGLIEFFFFVFSLSTFNYWISYQMCIVVCKTRKTAWIYLACRRRMPQGTNPDQLLYSHCRNPLFDSLYLEFTVVFFSSNTLIFVKQWIKLTHRITANVYTVRIQSGILINPKVLRLSPDTTKER